MDALSMIADRISGTLSNANIFRVDLSTAFDTTHRPVLWKTRYKIGIPVKMAQHICRGRLGAQLMGNTTRNMGNKYKTMWELPNGMQ